MSHRTTIKFEQLWTISIAWVLVAIFMSVYDHLVLHTMFSAGPSSFYSFTKALIFNCLSAVIGAALGGTFLVFHVNEKYIHKPFIYTISAVSAVYFSIIALIIAILAIVVIPLKAGNAITHPTFFQHLNDFLLDPVRVKNILTWYIVVAFTQLLLQISSKFGLNAFGKIIKGRYNVPHEEKKIFMFIDLKSSTALAERLGNQKYHNFLRDFFSDISDPIANNKGHIYQYVGDEVVIMWDYERGIENTHCVKCFFDIKTQIEKNKEKYLKAYEVVPLFKGAIHFGQVVAGEVGILKREITYSGDVLNTTARMQSMCNKLGSELIASSDLLSALRNHRYAAEPLGYFHLQGKGQQIFLESLSVV